jgi:hypothetical protein
MGISDIIEKLEKEFEREFDKTLKSVESIFKKNGWLQPRDWKEILHWHYYKYKDSPNYERPNIKDRQVYIDWGKDYFKPTGEPKKEQSKSKTLKQLFKEKFQSDNNYIELKKRLFKKDLLSADLTTWIGTKENGKIQLASTIKYIGLKYLNKTLSNNEVVFISEHDFNNSISNQTSKTAKAENGQFYFN